MKKPEYKLDAKTGEFIIENYNLAKPFANFFPGIAGRYGIPIWAFYVNRGQAIASFGTRDKDHAIMEYFPANRSWQNTPLVGFRTFLKINSAKNSTFYEPFANTLSNSYFSITNRMRISSAELKIEEENYTLGLKTTIEYFTIPNDNYGGLARIITLENTSKTRKKIQLLDGMPQVVPFGTNNWFLKKMSRTIEAWMYVDNLEKGAPFFKLAVDPADRPEVIHIKEGNFYLGFDYQNGKPKIIKPIVDPQAIFGMSTDLSFPATYLEKNNFTYPKDQVLNSRFPCAFILSDLELKSKQSKRFYCLAGFMLSIDILNRHLPKITRPGYLEEKQKENREIISGLQADIQTQSSKPEFDLYAKQTYLDNILRGGYPATFTHGKKKSIFYLYSRKHGDLERDYNKYYIQPTYLSQGNGNYRDVNQNRRSDVWFNPNIKDENIITFFNLIQTDGFNPLILKSATFILTNNHEAKKEISGLINKGKKEKLFKLLEKPFSPGEVILFLEEHKIKLKKSYDEFLSLVLSLSHKNQEAEHGEGFWTDHWTYNLDLLESYLAVYPEKLEEIVFQKKVFTFFDNAEIVKPRGEKYLLYNGRPRQLHSVVSDPAKKELIKKRLVLPHLTRTEYGHGDIYHTTLINKLLCLVANKMASLDPFGAGLEMEADKPNWYDALNGLPALFGSSLCETLELKRYLNFIKDALDKTPGANVSCSEEIFDFLNKLGGLTAAKLADYEYWDKTHTAKEEYRHKTRLGVSGEDVEFNRQELINILELFLRKLGAGIEKSRDKNIYYSYFINEVAEYQNISASHIMPSKFIQKKIPLFLEGQMHALKISQGSPKKLYAAVKTSELYDKKLKMYKITASLLSMPEEIGRCRVFAPGWLENESIWLHMEYKYLLEVLRSGLNEEFYQDIKSCFIPFQKPDTYGRSILENSSFLVSSAFGDKKLAGTGFVARLSGSTAEFIQIWLVMTCGLRPFFLDENGELALRFDPKLASWLFDKKGNFSFNFLGRVKVNYHNIKRKDTFGKDSAQIIKIALTDKNDKSIEFSSSTIPFPYSGQIRSRLVKQIDIYLD